MLGAAAVVLAIVWWNSAFENRASKRKAAAATGAASGGQPAQVDRSQSIGRGAGRLAGTVAKSSATARSPTERGLRPGGGPKTRR